MVAGRWRMIGVAAAVASLTLAACGGGGSGTKSGLTDLGKKLPKAIQDSGVVKIGSDIEYAPIEFFKENTKIAQGLDVDIANAMAAKLGVKAQFIDDTDFAGIILALRSGRFDIVVSAMNDTAERRGKGVDFIDYFRAGTSVLAKKGNPLNIQSLDDLCGKTVAVQKGTVQETDIIAPQQAKCTAAGKPKIDVLTFEKDTDALQQVKTGRAVADLEDFPVAAYNETTSPNDFQVVGTPGFEAGQYGIAVPKEQTKLRDTLQSALKAVIADGTYDKILQKWNLTGGALKTAPLNGG
jgi:polar amino acid transport system substrate-binding protein